MSSRTEVIPTRILATLVAVAFALCLFGSQAVAQVTIQPQVEAFGGYSWFHPNGFVDWGKPADIPHGWDASGTFYFPGATNVGIVVDGSGHYNSTQANVGVGLAGIQYKYHTDTFSPFARVMAGSTRIAPAGLQTEWRPAIAVGGGFDLAAGHLLSIRLIQFDYIYNSYKPVIPGPNSTTWNSIRLAGGLVFNLGNYYRPPVSCTITGSPTDVTAGEPVTVSSTAVSFNPKHTLTYAWTTDGGKMDTSNGPGARIDTTDVAAPNAPAAPHTAKLTITDSKYNSNNVATCSYTYNVAGKVTAPPTANACSVNPSTVNLGEPVTVTASATGEGTISSYAWTASSGQVSGTGATATFTGNQPGTVTISYTATDQYGKTSQSASCQVTVNAPPAPQCSARTPIQFIQRPHQKYIPARVDNEAKAILDDDASALKNDPNAKIVIVGYADGEPPVYEGTGKNKHQIDLAAQRAVNAKAYLVQQQGIDPSRIEVRKGTGKDHVADIIWLPQGADPNACDLLKGTTPVDESVVKPSENAYPKPHTAAPVHHKKAKPATGE